MQPPPHPAWRRLVQKKCKKLGGKREFFYAIAGPADPNPKLNPSPHAHPDSYPICSPPPTARSRHEPNFGPKAKRVLHNVTTFGHSRLQLCVSFLVFPGFWESSFYYRVVFFRYSLFAFRFYLTSFAFIFLFMLPLSASIDFFRI